jgi:putative membrane protein
LLSEAEKQAVTARVARVEAATGVQVVTAVAAKADAYPELVWIAFALAASLAGLAVVVLDLLRPDWMGAYAALTHVAPVLGLAAASALGAVFVPRYARLFLRDTRRDVEVRQYAQCLFLDHDLCRTHARTAVLLLVARFEHKVELVADAGFRERVARADWQSVVDATTAGLARGDCAAALLAGLDRLEALLRERGYVAGAPGDELPDAPLTAGAP